MSIAPFLRCSDIKVSLNFYTNLLDFTVALAPNPDPESFMSMYAVIEREGSYIRLSQHAGDGVYGSVIYVQVKNLDEIYGAFLNNGLKKQDKSGISMEPVEQTWGMKEFYVVDPDGNRLRFGQQIV